MALAGGVDLLGGPHAVVVGLAFAIPVLGTGDLLVEIVLRRRTMVLTGLQEHLAAERGLGALDHLEEPTHGHLTPAVEALAAARERMLTIGGSASSGIEAIIGALAVIESLEESIRNTGPARALRGRRGGWLALGGLAAKNSYHADDDPMTLYQDPLNLPDWIRGPRLRDALMRVGAVLDDVRLLHDAQIEESVLLFTMWSRSILVAIAPLLAAASFGRVPLAGGLGARDVPWLIATALSLATALGAPWTARRVMRRDELGAKTRRCLLMVEVPVAVAAMVSTPCWPVATFTAGWTNWWQRPKFSWTKLVVWMIAVSASLSAGMALAGIDIPQSAVELASSMFVVAVIGSSQGAMLPISSSMLAQVVIGGLASPRRARHRADEQISSAIRQLLEAADVIETRAPPADSRATTDAESLRGIAAALAVRADKTDSWAGRAPLGLAALLETALDRGGGPRYASPTATYRTAEAGPAAHNQPLTILPPSFYSDGLATLRLKHRRHARALSLLVVKVVEEARRYGSGAFETRCRQDENRLVLRFANPTHSGPRIPGRGTGYETLSKLASEIPGCVIDSRGPVDGTFIDLPPAAGRFGVQVSLPLDVFEDPSPSCEVL